MADDQFSVPVNITTTDGQVVPVLLPPTGVAQTLPVVNSYASHFDGNMVSLDLDALRDDPVGLQEPQMASEVMPTFVSLDTGSEVVVPHAPPEMGKLYYIAVCFLCFFAAFLPAQSLITTVFSTKGFWGLFLLYMSFSVSAFYATPVIKVLGVRKVLFIASCVNVVFIGTCIPAYKYESSVGWLFFLACGLFGLAGAPLWVSQGIYLSRLTQHHPEVVGHFNGTFLGIFFTAAIIGNVLTSIVGFTFTTLPIVPIFCCLLVLAVIAAILFHFLPEPPVPIVSDPPVKELYLNMWRMTRDKGILLMSPYYLYLGIGCTFAWGVIPKLLPDNRLVSPIAAVYGLGTLSASFISGRVYDRYGWKPLAIANFVIVILGFLGVTLAYKQSLTWIYFVTSVLFGSFEALANTLALSVLMQTYTNNSATAFFYYRLFTGFGNALGFVIGVSISFSLYMILLGCMCGITLILFAFYIIFIRPAEAVAAKTQFTDNGA